MNLHKETRRTSADLGSSCASIQGWEGVSSSRMGGVRLVVTVIRENRLRWFRDVKRRRGEGLLGQVMEWEVAMRKAPDRPKRGREPNWIELEQRRYVRSRQVESSHKTSNLMKLKRRR